MDSELRHEIEDFYISKPTARRAQAARVVRVVDRRRSLLDAASAQPAGTAGKFSEELSKPGEGYYFDDDKKSLKIRVERAYSKIAWAEMPPSRTRHLITNVRIKKDDGNEIEAHSQFSRLPHAHGNRQRYLCRRAPGYPAARRGSFKIARRTIILDQAVLDAKNISVFL